MATDLTCTHIDMRCLSRRPCAATEVGQLASLGLCGIGRH